MGSSTALHLARRGYRDVTILDTFPIPSAQSAGNDLNKIAGGGERTGWKGALAGEIMKGWREDSVFAPYYHEVGRVRHTVSSDSSDLDADFSTSYVGHDCAWIARADRQPQGDVRGHGQA